MSQVLKACDKIQTLKYMHISLQEIKNTFEKQGYVVLKQFFDPAIAQKIYQTIQAVTASPAYNQHILNKEGLLFYSCLYQQDAFLQEILSSPELTRIIYTLAGGDVMICWDQMVKKTTGGAEFPWHQDNGYYKLRYPHFQCWIALSPNFVENGCIQFIPESHKKGLMKHKLIGNHEVAQGVPENVTPQYIQAEPGDIVLFSSLTLHKTGVNTSQIERCAYVVEYMSIYDFDPFIPTPFLQVTEKGKPITRLRNFYPGWLNPISMLSQSDLLLQYVWDKLKR